MAGEFIEPGQLTVIIKIPGGPAAQAVLGDGGQTECGVAMAGCLQERFSHRLLFQKPATMCGYEMHVGAVDEQRRLQAMDGLARSVGNGITGLVGGAFEVIGGALRGIVHSLETALPGGLLAVVVFVVLVVAGWSLAKR